MKRVSLGIILPGDPDCVQEKRRWISILGFLGKRGWIICLLITLIVLFSAMSKDSGDLFITALELALMTAIFGFCAAFIWCDKFRCPYCKHFRTMQKISDENFIGSSERAVSRNTYDNHSGLAFDLSGNSAYYAGTTSRKEYGTETTNDYTYNMRCSCCGCVNKVKISRTYKSF